MMSWANSTLLFFLFFISFSAFAKDYSYKYDGNVYEGYVLNSKKGAPLIFIVHDWDGLTDYEKKRSQMLKGLGFSVFSIDMYGKGVRPTNFEDKKKMSRSLYADRKKMRGLMNQAFKEAKKLGLNVKNALAVGYCFGGTSILEWAKSGVELKGFASFHGNLAVKEGESYENVKSKIAVFHGTADQAVSMDDFAGLAKHLEEKKIPHEMITYSGAPHAFTVFGSERYRENADKKSWMHFQQFLKEQL